ncbi:MAG: LPXTG cell wall anchor domain-containing protein [Candidatus Moranbacteria bacterium]|nr:LPXTG cell wall anchor domain-containing protein [Candidatus Moranbacteria bacterium]
MKKLVIILFFLLMPVLTFAQDTGKKKAYFFYGDTCPHCKKVEAYFQENGIYDKYDITSLEFSNPFNTRLLLKFGDVLNDPNKGAVPAVAFGDKLIVGDQPIIDNFVKEIDVADNANELPDPDKIAGTNGANTSFNKNNSPVPAASGNKKNYFPVIVGALVVLGVGALIFVNRKKQ